MNVRYIDTHCHLQFEQYAHDRDDVIARMREEGIAGIIVGVDIASSREARALAEKHEYLFASVGLHPNHAESFGEESFRELAENKKVVAIGECGLDYFHLKSGNEEKDAQKELFKKHLALAAEFDKPLIIHARSSKGTHDAYQDFIAILKETKIARPKLRGVVHFFAGSLSEAETLFALDFFISFTAVITFSRDYDALIRAVPLANILSETDAPYVAPARRRGERNDPLAVVDVVRQIADIRGEDSEFVRAALLNNSYQMFALKKFDNH
ncbi:MAG: TatD family hydrolase [Minisyncoccia bacterium]|jgi:TatD DNase family protein